MIPHFLRVASGAKDETAPLQLQLGVLLSPLNSCSTSKVLLIYSLCLVDLSWANQNVLPWILQLCKHQHRATRTASQLDRLPLVGQSSQAVLLLMTRVNPC